MKRLFTLTLLFAALAAAQYVPNVKMTKGNVSVTLEEMALNGVQDRFRLSVDSKDPAVNAFKVTLRMDYLGMPISRSFMIVREPFNNPLSALLTTREISWPVWGQISWIRYILIEEQKTASGQEF